MGWGEKQEMGTGDMKEAMEVTQRDVPRGSLSSGENICGFHVVTKQTEVSLCFTTDAASFMDL